MANQCYGAAAPASLDRMHLVLRGDGVDRLNALQGFERDPGFQLRAMLTSLL